MRVSQITGPIFKVVESETPMGASVFTAVLADGKEYSITTEGKALPETKEAIYERFKQLQAGLVQAGYAD